MDKRVILCFYDYYIPDFSAGGPVTSLRNLVSLCGDSFQFRIITSIRSYQSGEVLDVSPDSWIPTADSMIWYASSPTSVKRAVQTLRDVNPVCYFNGMFSIRFLLHPLREALKFKCDIVISPRGMLQSGALRRGRTKKLLFLKFLQLSGLLRKARWHATDTTEKQDIQHLFGAVPVRIVPNTPTISETTETIEKVPGSLILVYYSLIAEKKNLHFLLTLLGKPEMNGIQLKIVGPVKDAAYWEKCKTLIAQLPTGVVTILGAVNPVEGILAIQQSHVFILPTLGENFGHAIVEALGAGRQVIISDKTPWKDLKENGAGYSLPLEADLWTKAILVMRSWTNEQFQTACHLARGYCLKKFNFAELKNQYSALFTATPNDNSRN